MHFILDKLPAHRTAVKAWIAEHPNVQLHFTHLRLPLLAEPGGDLTRSDYPGLHSPGYVQVGTRLGEKNHGLHLPLQSSRPAISLSVPGP